MVVAGVVVEDVETEVLTEVIRVVLDVKVVVVLEVTVGKILQAGSVVAKRKIRHKNGNRYFVLFILPFHIR